MAASACPLRFQPVCLAGGRLRAAHRRAAVVARQPPSRSMAGPLSLRGVGSLRAVISAPPMCRAGWSRCPSGWCRWWLLSGGDLNPPGPIGPPPASGGLAPPTNGGAPMTPHLPRPRPHHRAHAASAHRAGQRGLHPIPPPFPIRGRGRGVTSAAAGNGPPGTAARASNRSAPTPERTPKHTGKAPRPKAPGNSPLTNCPPLWYSCPRGVASAAAASAALQHLQGSPGATKARKV